MLTQPYNGHYMTTYKGQVTYGNTHFEAIKKMLLLVHVRKI